MYQMAIFIFLNFLIVNSMLFTMVKTIFKSEYWWPSYMFLNMVVQHSALKKKKKKKTCFIMLKTSVIKQ